MKVVLLCNSAANQRALANRLHAVVPISAIGIVKISRSRGPSISSKIASISVGYPLRKAWLAMMSKYNKYYPQFPRVSLGQHQGVNSKSVVELIKRERPDLVVVSGTDLLKNPLIKLIKAGGNIINLHTGISPYIKGGPNCTNWSLALGKFQFIGNTVMWLDAGIDSGRIVATERTPLTGHESLSELHMKVMDHAHDLYCRCIGLIRDGAKIDGVSQGSIGEGALYMSKDWNWLRICQAVLKFYLMFGPDALSKRANMALVDLDFTVLAKHDLASPSQSGRDHITRV